MENTMQPYLATFIQKVWVCAGSKNIISQKNQRRILQIARKIRIKPCITTRPLNNVALLLGIEFIRNYIINLKIKEKRIFFYFNRQYRSIKIV